MGDPVREVSERVMRLLETAIRARDIALQQSLREPYELRKKRADEAFAALLSAIAEIETERAELKDSQFIWETTIKPCWSALKDAQWDATRLRSALENWGSHHGWCAFVTGVSPTCNCGYNSALKIGTAAAIHGEDASE